MSAAANEATARVHAKPRREVPGTELRFRSAVFMVEWDRPVRNALEAEAADWFVMLSISFESEAVGEYAVAGPLMRKVEYSRIIERADSRLAVGTRPKPLGTIIPVADSKCPDCHRGNGSVVRTVHRAQVDQHYLALMRRSLCMNDKVINY
jgi:hypothetical protein